MKTQLVYSIINTETFGDLQNSDKFLATLIRSTHRYSCITILALLDDFNNNNFFR